MTHSFHIPVLGLAFSIDTPLKVAHYGISSVVSIVDDELIERMRRFHCQQSGIPYLAINKKTPDSRALRITAYLDLIDDLVTRRTNLVKQQSFEDGTDIQRYFTWLPNHSKLKTVYRAMLREQDERQKKQLQEVLRAYVKPGAVDVNIMAKVDKLNFADNGYPLDEKYTDAMAALRGAANSKLCTSVVLSAGMNPKLYTYLSEFPDFMPDKTGKLKKRIILKVSDYRSALIQAKFLAKKGLWVSEFRIESGLNCGGHAFATEGFLLGPILEEFKAKKEQLLAELAELYTERISALGKQHQGVPPTRFTVQGGIGTAAEHHFLLHYYELDGAGWGSPFLLVPEATTVDDDTLAKLVQADHEDFYVSGASPLGVPFNNFRKSPAEQLRMERIAVNRPGSPCTKKYLVSNTEFTDRPICTASRQYQSRKIKQLKAMDLPPGEYIRQLDAVMEKTCLCDGLAASAYVKNNLLKPRENSAVAICPGPNLAWFNRTYTLEEMINHIYGRTNLLEHAPQRPNLFINELNLYIQHIKKFIEDNCHDITGKKEQYVARFKARLNEGIAYYEKLFDYAGNITAVFSPAMHRHLEQAKLQCAFIQSKETTCP
ncbi:hypothetical protein JHJ32_01995 [Parapedobacter sp. ISTM3]|uniref:hypothetical protein n=1 Tax=Parapedobacter sp. ISTM3 TaxID=2800130 RepID=UPI00190623AD|nr:hypothetical protein [Parapedobacter sp. ISTM3]MBK1438745.1 hypothetical protein [Parapedobacter sp. ISTM3]